MGIRDRKLLQGDKGVLQSVQIPLTTAQLTASSTDFFGEMVPTFNGVIMGAEFFCKTFTNLTSVDVQIGTHSSTTTCLNAAITPTAGTAVEAVMAAIPPAISTAVRFGPDGKGAGTTIHAVYTAGSGPAVVGGVLTIYYRPRPLNGEVI